MPTRPYLFYALTNSVCSKCLTKVEAKIIFQDDCVYLLKHCPNHGQEQVLIADDIAYYKQSLEFTKPGDMPLRFNTPVKYGCPYDCGLCTDHEQHSCLTLVEVTDRCNLSCPICYADSGTEDISPNSAQARKHRSLEQIEYALQQKCVRGVTFQPIQAAGRLDGFDPKRDRYTLTEVRRSILQQSPYFKPEDLIPVPCHPDCLSMAYALKIDGKVIPLTGLIAPNAFVDLMPNSVLYEQNEDLKRKVFELFSASHSPLSSASSLKQLLCCLPMLPVPDGINYENIFRVMIVQFLDPFNFDVRSVKRSCIHIVHPDGRIIPFDTFNMFYRQGSAGNHLVTNRSNS